MRSSFGIVKASLVVATALFALGGCAQVYEVLDGFDPYRQTLVLQLPPPPPHLNRITVTNGAGKTVMESDKPVRSKGMSANPDLADLDGTLTISATWSDGRQTTQTLTHAAHMRVALKYYGSGHAFGISDDIPETAPATAREEPESQAGGD
jgi:hypothetical protein